MSPDPTPTTAEPAAPTPTDDASSPRVIRNRLYRDGALLHENLPLEAVHEYWADPRSLLWLDIEQPSAADLQMLDSAFGLHEIAISKAVGEWQRPTLSRYDNHLFLTAYTATVDAGTGRLNTGRVGAFITASSLVTVRFDNEFDMTPVVARWDASPHLLGHGVGFLVYALLDHLVDEHFRAVQAMDDYIDDLEDLLFSERREAIHAVQRRSFQLRKDLVLLRRTVLPMRELVLQLMRSDLVAATPPLAPYYQDLYDNVLRVSEWTESLRDLVSTIAETNLTVAGNRINAIMKKVTSWAAIIAVPTAITGYYGQNVPYPGSGQPIGVITSTALITLLSVLLYTAFRRKDWL